jgi:hypothetical protein
MGPFSLNLLKMANDPQLAITNIKKNGIVHYENMMICGRDSTLENIISLFIDK